MLPAGHRLRASADFTAVLRGTGGARAGSAMVVVHANRAGTRAGLPSRVGFVVSKAVGGAVVRNRTKRRLRALLAARLDGIPDGTDLVVRANPVAAQADWGQLTAEVDVVLGRVLRKLQRVHQGSTA